LSPCPSLALALALAAAPALPAGLIDVSGSVVATRPRFAVRVTLTNRGERPISAVEVSGDLLGETQVGRVAGPLAPDGSGDLTLEFPADTPRPGRNVLTLLLEHPLDGAPDAAGNPPMSSERAFLVLALGANPEPAVRIQADPLRLDVRGPLIVHLASTDSTEARVRLRVLTPRGLRAEGFPTELTVPARGEVRALVTIVRAGAPRGSRRTLLLVAESPHAPLSRTSVAAASVEVRPDPALLPRVRTAVLALGVALVLVALLFEVVSRLRARSSIPA
jgi:hypothetical protein